MRGERPGVEVQHVAALVVVSVVEAKRADLDRYCHNAHLGLRLLTTLGSFRATSRSKAPRGRQPGVGTDTRSSSGELPVNGRVTTSM